MTMMFNWWTLKGTGETANQDARAKNADDNCMRQGSPLRWMLYKTERWVILGKAPLFVIKKIFLFIFHYFSDFSWFFFSGFN